MTGLCFARLLVAWVPFKHWRKSLGHPAAGGRHAIGGGRALVQAQTLARQVERAALWLPFETKCLDRAMALSWRLRRRRIDHLVVFAVRPADRRDAPDSLHAWVELRGAKIIGDLPGPWIETLRLGR